MKLSSVYEPHDYEKNIYALWEQSRVFEPKNRGSAKTFSIVAPPPNANADLHIGYGLTMAIEDTIVRYHRLLGDETLFVPGADHAGFETWVVYEKKLNREGKSRFDFSREELYKQVWDFVDLNKQNFQSQLRALGASFDWRRFAFTLDDKVVAQTYQTFKKMWDEGLIYRGKRVVNFCTLHGTSFSDIEVVHEEEKSKLWHIVYPLADGSGEVVIATTRPETKLGQSALMVNPKDDRYKQLVGREVIQPLVPDKPIKIIADEYVDIEFGTGVVTVTPAHDPNDFEVAKRHKLPLIELITTEGKMSDNVPEQFRGLTIKETREAVLAELQKRDLLRGEKDYVHSVAKCYKCGTIIEPLLREQWFVNMQPLAEKAIEALADKKIRFYPDSKRVQLIRYLEGLKDWNISRQIAWGIPIPAFHNLSDPKDWIFDKRVDQETIEHDGKTYRRDPDVFDTWFSSGSWPYVTLNYPDGEEFKKFYPLSLMETGGEILYQWVGRMIMLGLYTTDEIPFKEVYIHGYVMAEDGRKMSKSLGNTVDLMEVINQYGTDALRMGILDGRIPAVNRAYDPRKIEQARNFTNKLWNVARFIEDKVGDNHHLRAEPTPQTIADNWILTRLAQTTKDIGRAINNYRLAEAYELLYHFVWHDLADWYIEASKVEPNMGVLAFSLEATLKMAHPFAPFVTETIWQTLAWEQGTILAVQDWPKIPEANSELSGEFSEIITVVSEIRHISNVLQLKKPTLYTQNAPILTENSNLVKQLAKLGQVKPTSGEIRGLRLTTTPHDGWLAVEPPTAKKYTDKLAVQYQRYEANVARLEARLNNPSYTQKAPEKLVEQTKRELEDEKQLLKATADELATFAKASENLS